MSIDDEINNEYKKIENEKVIDLVTLDNSKKNRIKTIRVFRLKKFAEKILMTDMGEELKNCHLYTLNDKRKLKIPLKIKIKRFLEKIKTVFGYGT